MAGRPRQFDIDKAVESALFLFIEKGYEGATFAELISAMKISPPSFYAAFGSKEQLFHRALELYVARIRAIRDEAIAKPNARAVVDHLLHELSKEVSRDSSAKGCLLVQGALVCSDNAVRVRDELQREREAMTSALTKRFRHAENTGDSSLPGSADDIARLTTMVIAGLAAQAASKVPMDLIDAAIKSYIALFKE